MNSTDANDAAPALVSELTTNFAAHIRRALDFELDGSETSLAWVDHYLSTLRQETRAPILELVAAEAGAYFGEVVRNAVGARWLSDGKHPRRLRLLLRSQLLHFSPVDQAFEVLLGEDAPNDDPRLPESPPLDPDFHPNERPPENTTDGGEAKTRDPEAPLSSLSDAEWLAQALEARPQLDASQYFTLTGRLETLKLLLELLAHRRMSDGRKPREYGVEDYVAVLADSKRNDGPKRS